MDADGRVAFRALWSNDERVIRYGLEAVAAARSPRRAERTNRVVPALSGAGLQYEILSQAGEVAKRDFLKQAPAMYATARLTTFFRPLSPLARGIAATALQLGLVALAAAALRKSARRRRRAGGRHW
jgi:hypothetical protein